MSCTYWYTLTRTCGGCWCFWRVRRRGTLQMAPSNSSIDTAGTWGATGVGASWAGCPSNMLSRHKGIDKSIDTKLRRGQYGDGISGSVWREYGSRAGMTNSTAQCLGAWKAGARTTPGATSHDSPCARAIACYSELLRPPWLTLL